MGVFPHKIQVINKKGSLVDNDDLSYFYQQSSVFADKSKKGR